MLEVLIRQGRDGSQGLALRIYLAFGLLQRGRDLRGKKESRWFTVQPALCSMSANSKWWIGSPWPACLLSRRQAKSSQITSRWLSEVSALR